VLVRWFSGWSGTAKSQPEPLFTAEICHERAHLLHFRGRDILLWYVTLFPVAVVETLSVNMPFNAHFLCLLAVPAWPTINVSRLEIPLP
jgi:hypothetical protein